MIVCSHTHDREKEDLLPLPHQHVVAFLCDCVPVVSVVTSLFCRRTCFCRPEKKKLPQQIGLHYLSIRTSHLFVATDNQTKATVCVDCHSVIVQRNERPKRDCTTAPWGPTNESNGTHNTHGHNHIAAGRGSTTVCCVVLCCCCVCLHVSLSFDDVDVL